MTAGSAVVPGTSRPAAPSVEALLARRLGLLLALYATVRVAFLIRHHALFADVPAGTVLHAFLHGLRFDLSAIAYSNAPFILLSLAPAAWLARRWYQQSLRALFVGVNGALTIVMVGDVGYFPFTGTRVTAEVFALSGEAVSQAVQLLANFAGLTALAIALAVGLAVFYPQGHGSVRPRSRVRAALGAVCSVALAVLAARGGVQRKPLKPLHAFTSGNHAVGVLTLNSAFTLLHTPRERPIEPQRHFADDREAEVLLRAPYGYRPAGPPGARRANVLLLVLESFGTEFWGADAREEPGLTPFLDSLAGAGIFLRHGFANGRRSMDALPSLLLGVPLYVGRSIAVSRYQGNEWRGLGHFLEREGYHTSMFHGAPRGTMFFDAIAAMAGIRDFYPLERFPAPLRAEDFDGDWGLFDEPALQFVAAELTRHRQPWFSVAFTISTHHPYTVPDGVGGDLPEGTRPIHRSVAYVDRAVREFFEAARTQPWFDNTLFVITGDHTAPARSRRFDTPLGRYMVPILLYHPSRRLPAVDPDRIVQHVDVFATVLDYTGARPVQVPAFGRSIFSAEPGEAVLAVDELFWLVRGDGVLERTPDGHERLVAYRAEATGAVGDTLDAPETQAELSRRLLAHLQHFTVSMAANSFYRESGWRTTP